MSTGGDPSSFGLSIRSFSQSLDFPDPVFHLLQLYTLLPQFIQWLLLLEFSCHELILVSEDHCISAVFVHFMD